MKLWAAFFKLIRYPNLIYIALTQFLLQYCVVEPVLRSSGEEPSLPVPQFVLLSLSTILVAAAGYIINDYFDVNIDLVNKSSKVIIGKFIKRRWAIVLHAILSFAGLVLSMYVGWRLQNILIPLFNFLAIFILLFYSSTFKKKLLIGNILISLLTAWVILVMTLAEYRFRLSPHDIVWQRLLKLSFIYAGFAFIISLVREVVKDMEDREGDVKYGCTTMPIVWGIPVSKVFAGVWIVVLTGLVMAMQIYVIQLGWWFSALYSIVTIVIPLIWVLRKLYEANTPKQFHQLSSVIKIIMLAGIISMAFF